MLENIVVAVLVGGFAIFTVWGLRVAADQARQDVEAARRQKDIQGQQAKRAKN